MFSVIKDHCLISESEFLILSTLILFFMYNFYDVVITQPQKYRQLSCDESLVAEFNCPLENRMQDLWSHHNYFVYVLDGKKIWHTPSGSFELVKDSCVFVRKGASLVEQFFDAQFCVILFFVSDEFICETMKQAGTRPRVEKAAYSPIIVIENNPTLAGFFHSIIPYFSQFPMPDKSLLELKFKELLLNVSGNPANREAMAYFCALINEPSAVSLERIMEDNFCYNLSLEQYAQLCNRSLSAFKRDFSKVFNTTPGKWIATRRLEHANMLLRSSEKSVGEVAFESGFENLSHFSKSFRQHFGITPASVKMAEG